VSIEDMRIDRSGAGWRIAIDRVFRTDRADLWSACTERERLGRWMAPYRGELRLGGRWEALTDGDVWGSGTVLECDPPNRFTSSWEVAGEPPSVLEVRLEDAPGGTRLLLRHDGVVDPTYPAGWATYLDMLGDHLTDPARTDVGPDGFARRFPSARAASVSRLRDAGWA
jgi:uncharacterized protein YndB with AHSA1/START domain